MTDRGWCRRSINLYFARIRGMFRWAVGEEMIPESVHASLKSMKGLEAGRMNAIETLPVRPVSVDAVERIWRKHTP